MAATPEEPRGGEGRDDAAAPRDAITADRLLGDAPERLEELVEKAIDAELATGRHEASLEEVRRNLLVRLGILLAGTALVITGLILMVIPGPGLLVLAIGLGVLSSEVPFAARLLERVKKRLPQDADGKLPRSAVVTMVCMTVAATAGSIAWTLSR